MLQFLDSLQKNQMIKAVSFALLFLLIAIPFNNTLATGAHPVLEDDNASECTAPSSYYATNPAGQEGLAGTITIDGDISDWSSSMLICQGVANDDPRIFKGSHEGPVYDLYAMYAAWDNDNLYLMWQYSNVTDVSDPGQGFPISDNGKPWNGDIPIAIALDVDPAMETDGIIDSTMTSVWHNGNFINYQNGMDHLLMFSSKPGVGVPALFKMNANGAFDYNAANVSGFDDEGIEYQWGDEVLSSTIYGINSNGYSGYTPADLADDTQYVDFNTLGHDSAQETFYEMKIPFTALGIDLNYLQTNGIGAMIVSTFGQSAIESLPHDDATLDNALVDYTADASTSHEKEDLDIFTEPMARIGAPAVQLTIVSATLNFNSASTLRCNAIEFPKASVTYDNGSVANKTLTWSPAPDFYTEGTTTYTGTLAGWPTTFTFSLTVNPNPSCVPGATADGCDDYFTWDNATVYFALVDRFNDGNSSNNNSYGRQYDPVGGFHGGDFAGMTQKINDGYFDDLGVNAIWFTAPYEQVHGYAGGTPAFNGFNRHYAFHGYYPLDWTEMDANYGTKAEFQAFVDAAHSHGIRLVMDIVLNHAGYAWDAAEYNLGTYGGDPNWCNWWIDSNGEAWVRAGDANYNICNAPFPGNTEETLSLAFLPDIRTDMQSPVGLPKLLQNKWDSNKENTEQQELNNFFSNNNLTATPANHIIKWLTDWVREYGIDGFRIDTYKHVERNIWGDLKTHAETALAEYRTNNPNKPLADQTDPFWMVGEWYGHGPNKNNEAAYQGQTDAFINFDFTHISSNPSGMEGTYSNYASMLNNDPDWTTLNYISSHDDRLFDRNNLYNGATSLLLAPGAAQIYYGDETKRPYIEDENNHGSGTPYYEMNYRSFMNWGSIDNNLLTHWQKLGQFRKKHPAIGAGSHTQLSSSPYIFKRTYNQNGKSDEVIVGLGLGSGSKTISVGAFFAEGATVTNAYTDEDAIVIGGNVTYNVGPEGLVLLEISCNSGPPPLNVFINPNSGNYPSGSVNVTLASTLPGATITYTVNGGTPTTYNGAFVIDNTMGNSVTVCATAELNGVTSMQACNTYTFNEANTITLTVKNDACSGTIYAYVFDVNGVADTEVAPWPGVPMTAAACNTDWYTYSLDADNFSVVFNCDGITQTQDLFVNQSMCWGGDFNLTNLYWGTCPSSGLSVEIAPVSASYPAGTSVPVTLTPCPAGASVNYTINGGAATNYTAPFSIDDSMGTSVTVCATATENTITSAQVCETYDFNSTGAITLTVKNDQCAGKLYAYVFDVDGVPNTEITPWPGIEMTPDPANPGYYTYTLDADNFMVVFNCDGSPQTQDLYVDQNSCWDGPFNTSTNYWSTCPTPTPAVTILPGGCNFPGGVVNVTLTSVNATAVYYTTDGTTPSSTNGTLYTGSFNVTGTATQSVTVNAIAYDGSTASPISSKTFTFTDDMTIYWDAGDCTDPTLHYFYTGFTTTWPGLDMVPTGVDDWFKLTIPEDCVNIVLSCNGANQTADLLDICGDNCYQNGAWVTCPTSLIDTTVVPDDTCPAIIDKTGLVPTDVYHADVKVMSNGTIMSTRNVSYKAGQCIELNSDFEVILGAEFEAVIEPCPNGL